MIPPLRVIAQKITRNVYEDGPGKSFLHASSLSAKYATVNKIGVPKWVPTNHISSIIPSLAILLYQICTRVTFDFGEYVF